MSSSIMSIDQFYIMNNAQNMEKTCYGYLLNLLNKKDYSEQELINKANSKSYTEEQIQEALERLRLYNFYNNERLATNLINFYKTNRGENWLYLKLSARLIPKDIIKEVLENIEVENYDELSRHIKSKLRITTLKNLEYLQYQKVYKIIFSRGYKNAKEIISSIQERECD